MIASEIVHRRAPIIMILAVCSFGALLSPPAVTNLHTVAPIVRQAPASSQLVAALDIKSSLVFPDTSGVGAAGGQAAAFLQENLPKAEKLVETEVLPALGKAASDAAPVLEEVGKELAPLGKQALDIVAPVVVQGAKVAGAELFELAKQVGSTAIDVGGKLAVEAGTAASAAATKAANDAIAANEGKIDPSIKKTAGEAGFALGKAAEVATPILAEGVREVTPFAQQAFGTITREGAKALKQALTEVEKEIDGYTAATPAASAPSGDVAAKIAQAEAERQALLSKIAELQ